MRSRLIATTAVLALCLLGTGAPARGASAVPGAGLRRVRVLRSLTGTHIWYRQTYGGHPVMGGYYARHFDENGRPAGIADGRRRVAGPLDPARLTAAQAGAMAGTATASTELVVLPGRARLVWAVYDERGFRTLVDATTGAVISRTLAVRTASGEGRVFDPNPVVTLQDESLTDHKDGDYAGLQPAYVVRSLTNLDGTGCLQGDYASVSGTTSQACSSEFRFLFDRHDDGFEQTMAYYDVTTAQRYIQSLGFSDINNEPQHLKVNQLGVDNSYYSPQQDVIKLGKGGVDDAEDAEVIWHELGHAIQDAQVPGFGTTHEAGSIGEGFGDYWAVTMSEPVSNGFELPCVADWDSTSYTSKVPHCLRRVDEDLTVADETGEVHDDGRIWSRALWDIHQALGRTKADTLILEAQFSFTPDISFVDAARATVAVAGQLFGNQAAKVATKAFQDRGIL